MKKQRIFRFYLTHKKWLIPLLILIPFIAAVSFHQILDRTKKRRSMDIEYIVIHYTANLNPGADARANARYLQKVERAGTHYCIDDEEIVQCTHEHNVAYAVGDKKWLGFIPKPWLHNKVKNNNSISYEMCLGGDRNDSLVIETTAQQVGWQIANKGFYRTMKQGNRIVAIPDLGRVVRHHDVTGKYCPKFEYINPKTGKPDNNYWNRAEEDRRFFQFKKRCGYWAEYHLKKLGKVN